VDLASRLTNYNGAVSPFLSSLTTPYLALANGGRYAGLTFVPADNLRIRLGAAIGMTSGWTVFPFRRYRAPRSPGAHP
jgi:hypothetical protein